jgi:Ca2+-binding RTX toxin-like protein
MSLLDPLDPQYSPVTLSWTSEVITGTRFNDVLIGTSRQEAMYGGGGDDYIDGGYEHDMLYGNSGNDTLIGGHGNDLLRGGPGKDTFKYKYASESTVATFYPGDTILDFSSVDFMDLSAIDADPRRAGNQAFRFLGQVNNPNKVGVGEIGVYRGDRGGIEIWADADKEMRITLEGTWSIKSGQLIL